jgi:hypothetical protein
MGINPWGLFLFPKGETMTRKEKNKYQEPEKLKEILNNLKGMKFKLDCGHHITFFHFLGNNITILNGKRLRIICSQCGY